MNILIIEDNQYKINELASFVKDKLPNSSITIKQSYISGLKEIVQNKKYQLVLLDMSMPNYDIGSGESGGDPIPLAGKLILNEMERRDIKTKVIVVTMYENFVDGTSLTSLHQSFLNEFKDNYLGYVFFSAADTSWKDNLFEIIDKNLK